MTIKWIKTSGSNDQSPCKCTTKKTLNRGKEETGKKDKRTEEKNDTKI